MEESGEFRHEKRARRHRGKSEQSIPRAAVNDERKKRRNGIGAHALALGGRCRHYSTHVSSFPRMVKDMEEE